MHALNRLRNAISDMSCDFLSLFYSIKPDHLSERGSSSISIHEMLTNQILPFHFETVATPWLQYVRLQIKQAMNL